MDRRLGFPLCECCNGSEASVYFVLDKVFACHDCEIDILQSMPNASNEETRRESAEEIFDLQNLHSNLAKKEPRDHDESCLFRFSADMETTSFVLEGGKALNAIDRFVDDPLDPLHVVSFIGRAGAGKSFFSHFLCRGVEPQPWPSSSGVTATTGDVAAYQGILDGEIMRQKFCLIDSEATNLSDDELPSEIAPRLSALSKESVALRRQQMKQALPRVLHEFSTVVVYVHTGQLKQVGHNLIHDLQCRAGASATTRKRTIWKDTHLIIILNKCSKSLLDEYHGSGDSLSLDPEAQSQVDLLFRSTSLVPIPHLQDDMIAFLDQLKILKVRIESAMFQSAPFPAASLKMLLEHVSQHFQTSKFTFVSILRSLIPRDESLGSHLASWFDFLLTTLSMDVGNHLAFDQCISLIQQNVILPLLFVAARHERLWSIVNRNFAVLVPYFEPILDSLEQHMQDHQPCYSTFVTDAGNELICTVVRPGHTVHQHSEEISDTQQPQGLIWAGVFVSSPLHGGPLISRERLVEQLLSLPPFENAASLEMWLMEAIHRFWIDLGVPRWSNQVCLACCSRSPLHVSEPCGHVICNTCHHHFLNSSRCNLCSIAKVNAVYVQDDRSHRTGLSLLGALFRSRPNVGSYMNLLDPAIICGDLDVCKWIKRVYPAATASGEAVRKARARGLVEIIDWLTALDAIQSK